MSSTYTPQCNPMPIPQSVQGSWWIQKQKVQIDKEGDSLLASLQAMHHVS